MIRASRGSVAAFGLVIALVLLPTTTAFAEPADRADRTGGYVFDSLILRPSGTALLVFGSLLAIPSYPLAMISGNQQTVLERCVLDPFEYTFTRPIGDF